MDTVTAKLALIGLGGISQSVHIPVAMRHHDEWTVSALVDLSADRAFDYGRRLGVARNGLHTSVQSLVNALEDGKVEVDAAIVATGGSHVDDTVRLIRAGVRVLSEKPLGYSLSEISRLADGLDAVGKRSEEWLRVGYMKEYDPAVAAMKESLRDMSPRAVSIEVLHPADAHQLEFARLDPPATDIDPEAVKNLQAADRVGLASAIGSLVDDETLRKLYTNVIFGSVIHDIALTRHLGLPMTGTIDARRIGSSFPGSVVAHGETTGNTPWTLGWHFIAAYPEYTEMITVHHESGTIELAFRTPYLLNAPTELRVHTGGDDLRSVRETTAWPQQEAFENELDAMLALVQGEPQPGSSLDEARRDVVTAQSIWSAVARSAGADIDPASEAGSA